MGYRIRKKCIALLLVLTGCISLLHSQVIVIIPDTSDYLPLPGGLNINLMVAASKGYGNEVIRMMKMGADVNAKGFDNVTPLIYAVANNFKRVTEIILGYDPDLEARTNDDETALIIASRMGYFEIAEMLIRKGADVNATDRFSASSLHYAAIYGDFYMSDMLIYYGADLDARTNDGTTPLMAAVWSGSADVSDLLIQSGAKINVADNNGFTPYILSGQNSDTLIASLLVKNGAMVNAVTNERYSALSYAIKNGETEPAGYFIKQEVTAERSKAAEVDPYRVARKYGRSAIAEMLTENNFNKYTGFNFEDINFRAGYRGLISDHYFSFDVSVEEPLYKLFIETGLDFKPFYTRIIIRDNNDENLFHQYFDQSFIIHGGVGKEFLLHENYSGALISLKVCLETGYLFANDYKGTYISPDNRMLFLPSADLVYKKDNWSVSAGYEYHKTGYYMNGPHWLRIGLGYTLNFNNIKINPKLIDWY